jgi:predicted RNA-binding Zn-ribbon protein involved in translation (DUF1610 family)
MYTDKPADCPECGQPLYPYHEPPFECPRCGRVVPETR